MALNLESKKAVVEEISVIASKAHSAIAAEYNGLTSEEMNELRVKARQGGVYLRVVKNTLARRAVQGTSFECMASDMVGPLVYAFSMEDPGAAARVLKDYAKDHNKLAVKLVSIGGQLLPASDLERLSKLPTREQALATLLATMRAPLDKFARTINEVPGKLVRTVAAIRDQKAG